MSEYYIKLPVSLYERLCAFADAVAPRDFLEEANREAVYSCPEYGEHLARERRRTVLRKAKERTEAVVFVSQNREKLYWLKLADNLRAKVKILSRVSRFVAVEILDAPRDDRGRAVRSITSSVWGKRIGEDVLARLEQLQPIEEHPFLGPTSPKKPIYTPGNGTSREGGTLE
jgi:hypothetical protein